jgi:mRNA-degrading endonuclease toxin of MazEF toxin-antitoxin module
VICPLTTVLRPRWPTRLQLSCAGKKADLCADQIRVLSKSRLVEKIGTLSRKEAVALCALLAEMYGEP